jgi:phasin family protein
MAWQLSYQDQRESVRKNSRISLTAAGKSLQSRCFLQRSIPFPQGLLFNVPGELPFMFTLNDEVGTQAKANFEHTLKFAETAADAAEQLFDLNLKTAKAAGADAVKQVKALAGAKDVQELTSLQTSFTQANADKVAGYSRAVYAWGLDIHGEISKLIEAQVAEANKTFSSVLDKVAKSAPSGSEFAFAAVKSAVSAANQAYDALTKAGKQVVDMTEATVTAGTTPRSKKAA